MNKIKEVVGQVLTAMQGSTGATPPVPSSTPRLRDDATPRSTGLAQFNTCNDKKLETAKRLAEVFCGDIRRACYGPGWTMSFCGRPDTGKTFLTRCVLEELGKNKWGVCGRVASRTLGGVLKQCTVKVFDWRQVCSELYDGEFQLGDVMIEPRLLVVDDISAAYDPKKLGIATLDRVLRAREDKWTIATFNVKLLDLKTTMEERIASFIDRGRNVVADMDTKEYSSR